MSVCMQRLPGLDCLMNSGSREVKFTEKKWRRLANSNMTSVKIKRQQSSVNTDIINEQWLFRSQLWQWCRNNDHAFKFKNAGGKQEQKEGKHWAHTLFLDQQNPSEWRKRSGKPLIWFYVIFPYYLLITANYQNCQSCMFKPWPVASCRRMMVFLASISALSILSA